jgi:hypothetical protein
VPITKVIIASQYLIFCHSVIKWQRGEGRIENGKIVKGMGRRVINICNIVS